MFFEVLSTQCECSQKTGSDIFILGDLNADLFHSELAQTKEFHGFCNHFLLYNLINCPTRITEHTSTCIDVILTMNPSRCPKADSVPFSESDHLLTYVKILVRGKKYKVKPKYVTIRNYLKIDKDALEKRFAECSWEEWFSHDDVNYCSEKFSVMLKEIMSDLIPVKTLRVRHSSLPWLRNPELIEARRKRDFAHRKALKVQSNEAWNDFRFCSSLILFNSLGFSTLEERRSYHYSTQVFRCVHGLSPAYLRNKLCFISEVTGHSSRNQHQLFLPQPMNNILVEFIAAYFTYNIVYLKPLYNVS